MGSMRVANLVMVPPTLNQMAGGGYVPVQESWPNGQQPVIQPGHVLLPQSQKSVMIPSVPIMWDAWNDYSQFYEIKHVRMLSISEILLRFWGYSEIRHKLSAAPCETILVRRDSANMLLGFSDLEVGLSLCEWIFAQEKRHKIVTQLSENVSHTDIESWLNNNVHGDYTASRQNQTMLVFIRDPDEAFHYEMRWRLPKD